MCGFGKGQGIELNIREIGFVGAYYVGQATTHRTITIALSKHCNCRVFGESYRPLLTLASQPLTNNKLFNQH